MVIAAESQLPLSDLGTYYLIRGWNLTRRDQGLEPISMPEYLKDAVRSHVKAEHEATLLDVAEEPRSVR